MRFHRTRGFREAKFSAGSDISDADTGAAVERSKRHSSRSPHSIADTQNQPSTIASRTCYIFQGSSLRRDTIPPGPLNARSRSHSTSFNWIRRRNGVGGMRQRRWNLPSTQACTGAENLATAAAGLCAWRVLALARSTNSCLITWVARQNTGGPTGRSTGPGHSCLIPALSLPEDYLPPDSRFAGGCTKYTLAQRPRFCSSSGLVSGFSSSGEGLSIVLSGRLDTLVLQRTPYYDIKLRISRC